MLVPRVSGNHLLCFSLMILKHQDNKKVMESGRERRLMNQINVAKGFEAQSSLWEDMKILCLNKRSH